MAPRDRPHQRIAVAIFAVLFFSYAYFPSSWKNGNIVSRMALAISLADYGTTNINYFQDKTIDKSIRDGNYYSDKAPGLAFMAVPVVMVVSRLSEAINDSKEYLEDGWWTAKYRLTLYLSTLLTSAALTAAAGAAIYLVAVRMGATGSGALVAAFGFGLASPAFFWATNFFGHASAGALLFLGFALAHDSLTRPIDDPGHEVARGFAVGGLLAWSVVVEFTSAPAAAIIGLYSVALARRRPLARLGPPLLSALGGGILAAIPLLIYDQVSFGSPFSVGYQHLDPGWQGMEEGLFGLTYPKLDALYGITLSPFRGLLVFCPLAALAPLAFYRMGRPPGGRPVACMSGMIVIYYLMLNSSYHYWDGGQSTGPRHVVPMLPFLFLPFAWLWIRSGTLRAMTLTLLALSFLVSLACVSVGFAPSRLDSPLFQYILPRFLSSEDIQTVLRAAGWRSSFALLPYTVLLMVGVGLVWRRSRSLSSAGSDLA